MLIFSIHPTKICCKLIGKFTRLSLLRFAQYTFWFFRGVFVRNEGERWTDQRKFYIAFHARLLKRRIAKKIRKMIQILKEKYYYMANLHIGTATFHRSNERSSDHSRGRQCAFRSLSAVFITSLLPEKPLYRRFQDLYLSYAKFASCIKSFLMVKSRTYVPVTVVRMK